MNIFGLSSSSPTKMPYSFTSYYVSLLSSKNSGDYPFPPNLTPRRGVDGWGTSPLYIDYILLGHTQHESSSRGSHVIMSHRYL